ncbi:MAG TPA: hypothetical protein VK574_11300 [Terracidiphilus sp.]|nr:hypothetical protein [Terracidiphilus sp.]
MKTPDDYATTWSDLIEESSELENKKAELEEQLDVVKKQITHLDEVLRHLAPLAGIPFHRDLSDMGITDAIRCVMEDSTERMSPQEVRSVLESKHFDFAGYSAPMSSIYKILGRLADDPDCPVRKKRDGNTVFYVWERPSTEYAQSAEISDDDIPF